MKINKSTLKMLIKEELETMVAEERPPTNAELTLKRLRSLLPEFAAVDAKADALMGNQKRMMSTLDTLPPEVHAEYKKHYDDYGRAKFGDSLREGELND